MKKLSFLITIFLILTLKQGISAQTHISALRAEHRNNLVRLTWTDSPEARGPVYIFRSIRAFGSTVPPNIRPIVVNYGMEFYIDDIDDIENVYYFIAASDIDGTRYDSIIPHINVIHLNINFPNLSSGQIIVPSVPAVPSPAAVSTIDDSEAELGISQQVIPGISLLTAEYDGEKVIISFNSTENDKNPVIYRSMQPIQRPHDLLNAIIVQTSASSPFTDFPVPGIFWYYAVIYEDEIADGNISITPAVNTTIEAVYISPLAADQSLRPIPLPGITLHDTRGEGFFPNENIIHSDLSAETSGLLRAIQLPARPHPEKKPPRIFAVDLQDSLDREESALSRIILAYFAANDWEGARSNLLHYLSFPRTPDIEIRARFYLAQSLYFLGNYREALLEFLQIRSHHTNEINSWIDAVLEAMVQ